MPLRMSSVSMRLASNQAWLPLHSRDCTSTVYQQVVGARCVSRSMGILSWHPDRATCQWADLACGRITAGESSHRRSCAPAHRLCSNPCAVASAVPHSSVHPRVVPFVLNHRFTWCNLFCTAVLSLPLSSSWLSMLCRVPWLHVAGELCCRL
ncbi:hypothetical protein FB45DRAFT_1062563, partial [Roridomyces roridus]